MPNNHLVSISSSSSLLPPSPSDPLPTPPIVYANSDHSLLQPRNPTALPLDGFPVRSTRPNHSEHLTKWSNQIVRDAEELLNNCPDSLAVLKTKLNRLFNEGSSTPISPESSKKRIVEWHSILTKELKKKKDNVQSNRRKKANVKRVKLELGTWTIEKETYQRFLLDAFSKKYEIIFLVINSLLDQARKRLNQLLFHYPQVKNPSRKACMTTQERSHSESPKKYSEFVAGSKESQQPESTTPIAQSSKAIDLLSQMRASITPAAISQPSNASDLSGEQVGTSTGVVPPQPTALMTALRDLQSLNTQQLIAELISMGNHEPRALTDAQGLLSLQSLGFRFDSHIKAFALKRVQDRLFTHLCRNLLNSRLNEEGMPVQQPLQRPPEQDSSTSSSG